MRIRMLAVLAGLIFAPTLALACPGHKHQEASMSCADGHVWDDASKSCVVQSS